MQMHNCAKLNLVNNTMYLYDARSIPQKASYLGRFRRHIILACIPADCWLLNQSESVECYT